MPGAHAKGANRDSIGICLIGNFNDHMPDSALWWQALDTTKWLMKVFNLKATDVYGHREVQANRTCPGQWFDMDKFRKLLT
jgi:N-acetylmuramoyl-L-alanine amidase